MTSLLGGRVGVSHKVTNRDGGRGGFGLFSKPKVTTSTAGHFWGGGGGVSPKVTNSDGGEGGVRPIK